MNPDGSPEQVGARLDRSTVDAAEILWQLPFMVSTAWWNLLVAPYLPGCPHHPHCDTHDQLVVPEPLEETGEYALFA